jgi:predicted NACHT family NTPase
MQQHFSSAVSDDKCLSLYCEALLTDPHITMVQLLTMQRPLDVAQIYVPLRLSQERQLKFDTPVSDDASSKTTEDDPDVWVEEERQRRERHAEVIYDPEKALQTFRRCVIIGGPGAGKTTLLRYVTIMAAQSTSAGMSLLLPVYVELQCFHKDLANSKMCC